MAGARARIVNRAIISSTTATSSGSVAVVTFNSREGIGMVTADQAGRLPKKRIAGIRTKDRK
jgi:hypothetical protein